MDHTQIYADIIKNLPEIDINLAGVKGYLMQGENNQMVFFELDTIATVPPHSHGAQWGMVVEGEMELTIAGKTKTYKKGDRYSIGKGEVHTAVFKKKTFAIDFFEDVDRYTAKAVKGER
jgi:quercetin dioxygenase-like cupin family protein